MVNLKVKFPINSIIYTPNKSEIIYHKKKLGKIIFPLECEQGDKISLNISSKNSITSKNKDFSLFLKFNGGNLYYFNHQNITIININLNYILFEFNIPYEIYCKSHKDIILNDSNFVNFNLNDNIFTKNNNIKLKELGIKIIDYYYFDYKDKLSKFPLMNFNKYNNYELNKEFKINFKNGFHQDNSFIIKYKGINTKTGIQSFNECSININKNNKRNLQTISNNDIQYYYTFGEIFDNEEAVDNMDDIVEFLNQDINVFNISEPFFQDLCIHYERNSHDYVLDDRIEFFYQNYSLCNTSCNLSTIYFENFSFSCICWPEIEKDEEKKRIKKEHSMELNEDFSMEGLSQEMGNLFFESNLSVVSCFFVLLREKVIMNNFGVIITGLLLLIQIIASLFLCSHMNDIRLYVFRDLIKCKFNPPLKRGNTFLQKQEQDNYNHNNNELNSRATTFIKINSKNESSVNTPQIKNEKNNNFGKELASIKGIIPINANIKNAKKIIMIDDVYDINYIIDSKPNKNIKKNKINKKNYIDRSIQSKDFSVSSQRKLNVKNNHAYRILKNVNKYNKDNINIYKRDTERYDNGENEHNTNYINEKNENSNGVKNTEFSENNIENINHSEKDDNINNEIKSEHNYSQSSINLKKKQNQDLIYPYEKKDYNDNDLDELDYDEALIYDKRTFCKLFLNQLLERQLIANTFWVKNNLKPLSIKVIVLIFNIACYCVINGFLFNEEYVMKILRRKSKGFYYFIVDSTTRIVYSSIIGAVINIIVGLLFRADKQLRKVQVKYKDNTIILHGEIVKIYKSTKMLYIIFTIFNVCAMLVFIFYLFCFCGVYRNCQADWFEGCFIVIFLMQFVPIVVSLLLAILRKSGLKCKLEFLFKINSWIIENL